MAVGGVFTVDLLALPPQPKKVSGWTLRQVTPLASCLSKLPYPIPPAGGDIPAANAAAAPPMGLTFPLPSNVVVLDAASPEVGWWDAEETEWKTDGVTDVSYDAATHMVSFQTNKLTSLALITSRIKLLPYASWLWRPQGPAHGKHPLSLSPSLLLSSPTHTSLLLRSSSNMDPTCLV